MPHADPIHILQQYWGYPAFRPLQEDIMRSVLQGRDTLALMPTGGGKSLCYQVPALCQDGLCLVISPLIALMKDQVDNLKKRGVPAAAIFSGMYPREIDMVFENACNGAYKLLYISPERLKTELAQARIARMNINLLAVDEAHCISQWGYDFRPSYLQIAEIRPLLPQVPLIALTATATPTVVADIQEKLEFRNGQVFQQSFQRANLSYSVLYENKKREKLFEILRSVPGSGVVYVRSRGETKEIAQYLIDRKVSADYYHAGLTQEERHKKQQDWMDGRTRVIVCTNAFGMGIDKPDVRTVVHLNLPDSLEAYFQEAGRAGRDGNKAYAVLLYADIDADNLRFQFQAAYPAYEQIRRVYQALGSYTQLATGAGMGESFDFDLKFFCHQFKLEQGGAHAALKLLEQEGWIVLSDAAHVPARAFITASREELYDYQLKNKAADVVSKVMLRAYPGIQLQPIDISENTMAKFAKMPVEQVRAVLEKAQKEKILEYWPAREQPQITFTRPRAADKDLALDTQKFEWRKKSAEERLEKAIQYAVSRKCRSVMLLEYFGEKKAARCGICDVCTGRNKSEVDTAVFEATEQKIVQLLRQESLSVEDVLESFASKRHETIARVLNYLLDEGRLSLHEDGKLHLP